MPRRTMVQAEREAGRLLRRYVAPAQRPRLNGPELLPLAGLPEHEAQAKRAELEGAELLAGCPDADELVRACAAGNNEAASALARGFAAVINGE